MTMDIRYSDQVTGSDHLVLLGRKTSDFSRWLDNDKEKNYVSGQLEKEKTFIAINQFTRYLFIQVIEEKEKLSRAGQLESLRSAASELGRRLNHHDVESVMPGAG